jgi:blocked-early-in-transport protein 1
MLDGMGSSLGQTTDLLTSTIGKIGVMVSSGGSKHMCYLVLFVVVFFMMLYFMMRK